MQGAVKQGGKVTAAERLSWAHDAMMRALRLAIKNRHDRVLVSAALSRADEYDVLLAAAAAPVEPPRRGRTRNPIPETAP